MAAQKHNKKNCWQNIFAFLNAYYPKTQLIKIYNFLDSSRPYGRLLENPKTRGCRELFLPENDFQTSSTQIFPKKHLHFGGLETNQRHEIQIRFFSHALLYMNST